MFGRSLFSDGWKDAAVLLMAMAASASGALMLGRDASWDLQNYHYYAGFSHLHKTPFFDFSPAQMQSFFNPLMHVPTYLLYAHLPDRAVALILGALQGLNAFLIYRIAFILFSGLAGLLRFAICLSCAAAGFYGAANLSELGTTFGDNLLSVPILAAFLIILRAGIEGERRSAAAIATCGLITGAVVGLKPTFITYAAALFFALVTTVDLSRKRFTHLLLFGSCVAAGYLSAYGAWGWALWREFENPLFPFLGEIFGTRYSPASSPFDLRFFPRDAFQALFYPFYFAKLNDWVAEITFRDPRLALCYLLLAAWAVLACTRRIRGGPRGVWKRPSTTLVVFFCCAYIFWQSLFSIYRYALVLELLAPVVIALAFFCLLQSTRTSLLLGVAAHIFICASMIPLTFGRVPFSQSAFGAETPHIESCEDSLVMMAGSDANAWIIPSFPVSTRFVRVPDFIVPGEHPGIEHKIRSTIETYHEERIFIFAGAGDDFEEVADAISCYGLLPARDHCQDVNSGSRAVGRLCRTMMMSQEETLGFMPEPELLDAGPIQLSCDRTDLVAGRDTMVLRVENLEAGAVDFLYTVDGRKMPPLRGWTLREDTASVFIGRHVPRGLYHIYGMCDARSRCANRWYRVETRIRIR